MATAYQSGDILKNRYRIVRVLGQGGFAITYEAEDIKTKSSVAIKVISLKQLENWKQIELFQREVEVLEKLEHPAIPKYIDYFDLETETDKSFYIVQELASGKSLFDLVESGWRTTEVIVKNIAEQVLNILSYLHSLEPSIIHRDIKPNNLIYSDDGKIYLVDFGAVQNTYYNTLMQGSTVVGTYGYMAPEQFRGKAVTATDLYSLGATLLYLLTHRSPSELPQDTLKLNFRSSVNISESFSDWLENILEPDLEDRFSSADVALAKLLNINKVKHKKLFTNIVVGVLCLGLTLGFSSYKWFFLNKLGFYPIDLCSNISSLKTYLQQGGTPNIKVHSDHDYKKISIINCVINNYRIKGQDEINIVELLIKKGADVNIKDKNEYYSTPLLNAVHVNRPKLVQLLIKYNADVNLKDSSGKSPLILASSKKLSEKSPIIIAASKNNLEIINVLIKNQANINVTDNHGNNIFFYTKTQKYIEFFLDLGVNIHHKNKQAQNALFYAKNAEIIDFFIQRNLDINLKDKNGETPLSFAIDSYHTDVAKILIDRGADVNTRYYSSPYDIELTLLSKAIKSNGATMVKYLIDNGAEVDVENARPPLVTAIIQKDKTTIKLLLQYGADKQYLKYKNIKKFLLGYQEYAIKKFLEENNFENKE